MNKVVLITGTPSPVRSACAERLDRAGFSIYELRRARAEEERAGEDERIAASVVEIVNREGGLHVLINCGGYALAGAVEETVVDEARAEFEANFFSVHRVIRGVLPVMREQGSGLIINLVARTEGKAPFFGFYSASSQALRGLTKALQVELLPFGVGAALVEVSHAGREVIEARTETFDAQTSPVYWEEYRHVLESLKQEDVGIPPDTLALLIEELIGRGDLQDQNGEGNASTSEITSSFKQVTHEEEMEAISQPAVHLPQMQLEAGGLVSFEGKWALEEERMVREAIYEFEARRHLIGEEMLTERWLCTCRQLQRRTVYIANRPGLGKVFSTRTAAGLVKLIRSYKEGPLSQSPLET